MNRCLNNPFAYCDTTPEYKDTPSKETVFDFEGNPHVQVTFARYCNLSSTTCGHHLTLAQSMQLLHPEPQPTP
ncbi:hypothetical protein ES705_27056 [subsurface metagenome]